MANTHDYSIANDTGSAVRTDLNTLFTEIEAANAGASAPTNTAEGKLWYDTGNNVYKMYDGSAWVAISAKMDAVSASSGGTFTGAVTLPSPVINTGVSGSAILDEDAMGSDSATQLATQQSIKAYVDANSTADQAFTTARVSAATTAAQGVGTGNTPEFAGVKITASGGINFSPYDETVSTPGSDSNLLDDYEEGTWTPTVTAASGTITTVSYSSGTYTKIGREVSLHYEFGISNIGTAGGNIILTNLPFAKETATLTYYSGIHRARSGTSSIMEMNGVTLQLYGTTPIVSTYFGSIVFPT
jgi:hypothetical protein